MLSAHFPGGAGSPVAVIANADQATEVASVFGGVEGIDPTSITAARRQGRPRLPRGHPDLRPRQRRRLRHGRPGPRRRARGTGCRRPRRRHDGRQPRRPARLGGGQQADHPDHPAGRLRHPHDPAARGGRPARARRHRRPVVRCRHRASARWSSSTSSGYAGADTSFPLFVFVFLVALGIDYNIFLMTRVREEALRIGHHRGSLVGLAATGGVITSAGLVLAGTFAVLGTLPLVAFAEIGFAVAFGVLLDTLVVRSILVTALNLDIGKAMWWPSSAQQAGRAGARRGAGGGPRRLTCNSRATEMPGSSPDPGHLGIASAPGPCGASPARGAPVTEIAPHRPPPRRLPAGGRSTRSRRRRSWARTSSPACPPPR